MNIAIGSDHAGFRYKEAIKRLLNELGHAVDDFGTDSEEPVDYPLFIRPVALAVARGEADRGVVLGGSGNGEAMVANRVKGVRCALCWNIKAARLARQHNDANMISIGQRMITEEVALEIVRTISKATSSVIIRWPIEIILASLCCRAKRAALIFQQRAQRTPLMRLATIASPLPEPPSTTPRSASPLATARATGRMKRG